MNLTKTKKISATILTAFFFMGTSTIIANATIQDEITEYNVPENFENIFPQSRFFSFGNTDFRNSINTNGATQVNSVMILNLNHTIVSSPVTTSTGRFRVIPQRQVSGGWVTAGPARTITAAYAWRSQTVSWTIGELGGSPGRFRLRFEAIDTLPFTTEMFRINGTVNGH